MIKDQPKVYISEQKVRNKCSQGRSHDYSDYYRIPLAFGLVYNQGPGFMPGLFSWRIEMEIILLNKVQILEGQLKRTQDTWLKRIWIDKINELMLKVSRLNKTN